MENKEKPLGAGIEERVTDKEQLPETGSCIFFDEKGKRMNTDKMYLVIAEKPSVSLAIAHVLGKYEKMNGAVDYADADDLVYKKSDGSNTPVKLAFFLPRDKDAEHEDFDFEKAEVRYTVNEICALLAGEKKDNGEPIEPKDIANTAGIIERNISLLK